MYCISSFRVLKQLAIHTKLDYKHVKTIAKSHENQCHIVIFTAKKGVFWPYLISKLQTDRQLFRNENVTIF